MFVSKVRKARLRWSGHVQRRVLVELLGARGFSEHGVWDEEARWKVSRPPPKKGSSRKKKKLYSWNTVSYNLWHFENTSNVFPKTIIKPHPCGFPCLLPSVLAVRVHLVGGATFTLCAGAAKRTHLPPITLHHLHYIKPRPSSSSLHWILLSASVALLSGSV